MSLRYTKDHEWVRLDGDVATVGISDHAQELLGDVVFVELPEVGRTVAAREQFASVDSVKATSEVYAPVSGEVVEVNTAIAETPDLVNKAAETDGWFARIRVSDPTELDALMDQDAYAAFVAAQ